ncbi:YjbQ family protein [Deferribacter autotrophicus]|uniref:YjbQ family protein n=1 Tax=Deferribacter autotrophicus TaxID=500465 RepID=A0A5A8F2C0_9BACT|nr:secondary thiamine-phosphate synthase enzyme YjbQ [Deferribacter autotrophicus]KAA0258220.1 YjbQ family protein [Deferribacter autotrophicus]
MIELSISSKRREELIDITSEIEKIVGKKGWNSGILHIYTPHTTAAITINENADYTVKEDIIDFLSKLVPSSFPFKHLEGNSDAHLKSSIIGCSENVIVENGRLVLGTWQGVFFCEFDGPRRRKVYLKFISS